LTNAINVVEEGTAPAKVIVGFERIIAELGEIEDIEVAFASGGVTSRRALREFRRASYISWKEKKERGKRKTRSNVAGAS